MPATALRLAGGATIEAAARERPALAAIDLASLPRAERLTVRPIRVVVRAAHPAVHAGLVALLEQAGHVVIDEHADAPDRLVERPDVIVAEFDPAAGDDLPASRRATVYLLPPGRTLDVPEDAPGALLRSDATPEELDIAVRAAAAGLAVRDPRVTLRRDTEGAVPGIEDSPLTPREIEVLQLLAAGMTNKGAALSLGISEHTVKFHVGSVLAKLGARSRTEAVSLATRRGLLPL